MDVINQMLQEDAMLREVSPILFLTDTEGWPVIAARTPDGSVREGDSLRSMLKLSAADEAFVGGWESGTGLVRSDLGPGLLSMRWRFSCGFGLFLRLEFPLPPETADAPRTERQGASASETLSRVTDRLYSLADATPRPDALYNVGVDSVVSWLMTVAEAVGCVVNPLTVRRQTYWGQPLPDLPEPTTCRWYPEPLWEAFLVTCLLLARRYDPTRMLSCALSVGAEEDGCPADVAFGFCVPVTVPSLSVPEPLRRHHRLTVEKLPPPPEQPVTLPAELAAGLDCLQLAADTCNAVFYWTAGKPEAADGGKTVLFSIRAHMVFLSNPHRELEGDVKADKLRLT